MNRSIDIGKAITFYTEDEKWLEKLGIGTALVIISTILSPILVGFAGFMILAGYGVRLLRNVRDGAARPLPEWDRWGEDLASGFKLFVALILYALPALVFMIPVAIGAIIADQSSGAEMIGIPFIIGGMCLMALYSIAITLMTPGITIFYARDETIGSALRFSAIWDWTRAHIGPVLIVALVNIAVSAVLGMIAPLLGILLCVVGELVTVPLATLLQSLIAYHMYGQLAQDESVRSTWNSGASIPPSAPVAPYVTPPGTTAETTIETWFEEALAETQPVSTTSEGAQSSVTIQPEVPSPGEVTPNDLGDLPNRPDDRPNLPQNPT